MDGSTSDRPPAPRGRTGAGPCRLQCPVLHLHRDLAVDRRPGWPGRPSRSRPGPARSGPPDPGTAGTPRLPCGRTTDHVTPPPPSAGASECHLHARRYRGYGDPGRQRASAPAFAACWSLRRATACSATARLARSPAAATPRPAPARRSPGRARPRRAARAPAGRRPTPRRPGRRRAARRRTRPPPAGGRAAATPVPRAVLGRLAQHVTAPGTSPQASRARPSSTRGPTRAASRRRAASPRRARVASASAPAGSPASSSAKPRTVQAMPSSSGCPVRSP